MWTGERAAWCGPAPMIHISGLGLAASYNPATFPNPLRPTPLSLDLGGGFQNREPAICLIWRHPGCKPLFESSVPFIITGLYLVSHSRWLFFLSAPTALGIWDVNEHLLNVPPSHCPVDVHSPPIPLLQHISFVSTWKIPVDCWTLITKDHW